LMLLISIKRTARTRLIGLVDKGLVIEPETR